ncbi:Cytosolic Fe-S cluster assembly factor nar1 [Lignoscripta atroalba]|nr:Cytosolic Fe-S cluster assembly factor nar1 [Lignoscripta atroalba]
MSAILSADDLNDFISPGVACIKPVETLPLQKPQSSNVSPSTRQAVLALIEGVQNPYEVTTEDKLPVEPPPPAQISLTDCLACSGCVTSAEAVLVSLQSHTEVLNALDSQHTIPEEHLRSQSANGGTHSVTNGYTAPSQTGKIFVASVSPQVRASLAATYSITEREAGWMIERLLSGSDGLRSGGKFGNGFTWVVDTNAMREACLVMGGEEVMNSLQQSNGAGVSNEAGLLTTQPKKPILTSACPGWICYAEKTHPHVLPHLSCLKSPQALTGTLLKTNLSKELHINPDQIWHLAIMPCFDKKLEASREELTDIYWRSSSSDYSRSSPPVRDVDCVITARELLMLADTRGISFPALSRKPFDPSTRIPFPSPQLDAFLFPQHHQLNRRRAYQRRQNQGAAAGPSGGYLYHILRTYQSLHPGSSIISERGRNADVVEYKLVRGDEVLFRAARYYGFRNIQNLVRKLKPLKKSRLPGGKVAGARKPTGSTAGQDGEYAYVEVMACPGGCTNGGGQIKVDDIGSLQRVERGVKGQKEWLAKVDEAYFSMDDDNAKEEEDQDQEENGDSVMKNNDDDDDDKGLINGISTTYIKKILHHWSDSTDIDLQKLVFTSYRKVESDVGKDKGRDTERVVELAGKIGGGW